MFVTRDMEWGLMQITSKKKKKYSLTGNTFETNKKNMSRFRKWWKIVNLEHFLIFWVLGIITMFTLALLAYTTSYGAEGNAEGIQFVINEATAIGRGTAYSIGILFMIVTGIMLSATQLTVLDSTSRIITENVLLMFNKKSFNVSKVYYTILWIQIAFGITVFTVGFDQPLKLIILGAIINAFTMFVYSGLILFLNNNLLKKLVRPSLFRNLAMLATFVFLGVFCFLTMKEKLGI